MSRASCHCRCANGWWSSESEWFVSKKTVSTIKVKWERKKKNIPHAQETSYNVSWAFPSSPLSFSHCPSSSSCWWLSPSKQVANVRERYLIKRVSSIRMNEKEKKKHTKCPRDVVWRLLGVFPVTPLATPSSPVTIILMAIVVEKGGGGYQCI